MNNQEKIMAVQEKVAFKKLLWVGPLAIVASVIAVLIVRTIAVALLNPPPAFAPLGWGSPIFLTTVLVTGSVITFALVGRFARRPIRTYQIIAVVVLIISFIPDILLLFGPPPGATPPAGGPPPMGGVTVPNVIALMIMHVTAWAVSVGILTRLARE
jgi:hypothetical protein